MVQPTDVAATHANPDTDSPTLAEALARSVEPGGINSPIHCPR
ncbi:hypothetical protein [Streptomyces europaeiscabiei]|nr:hypothetical protein [Streptomyces europaeiscabiei]MDX3671430.1 hypothetical protein [Streptomyces europaeiscabiei]MDX3836443.1 hypothetical protein [Streptomyces europaeiscabiei]